MTEQCQHLIPGKLESLMNIKKNVIFTMEI